MTIINPNSIAGITSVTAQADIINFYKSNGNQAGLGLNGVNFNTTAGISTFNNLVVGGTLTYEDVKNVDSIGIITARGGLNVTANTDTDTLNVSGISTFGGTLKIPTVPGTNTNGLFSVLYQTASGTIDGGSGLRYDPGGSELDANGLKLYASQVRGNGNDLHLTTQNYNGTCDIHLSNILRFETGSAERLRITSDGWCMLNTSTLGSSKTAKELIVSYNNTGIGGGDQGRAGITIRSGQNTSSVTQPGYIFFSDGTSGSNESIGTIVYEHANDGMYFATAGTERLRITSTGEIKQYGFTGSTDTSADDLVIGNTDSGVNRGITIWSHTSQNGSLVFADNDSNFRGAVQYLHNGDVMRFLTAGGESFRTTDGHVLFSGLTTKNDTRNAKGITIKSSSSGGGISFQNFGANGSKNWRIRPDDLTGWGTLEFSVSPTANSSTDWPDHADDVVLTLQPDKDVIVNNGNFGIGLNAPETNIHIKKNDAVGPTITLENNANKVWLNNWGSTGGGSGRTNRFELNATLNSQASYCAAYHTFMVGGVGDSYEKLRIDSNGNVIIKRGSDQGNIIQMTGADTTSEILEAGIVSGYVQFTASYAAGGNNSCGFIFKTRNGSSGTAERIRIEADGTAQTGSVRPRTNNTFDLGTNSYRWANIHTNDLNLSNEGSVNEVDGTWGQYTIQEGENDLFLINRRNGKKYKFLLKEVD